MPTAVKKPTVKFLDWGLVRYQEAWERQDVLLTEGVVIKTNNRKFPDQPALTPKNYLVFCEHPHVYTLGKSGSLDNLLLSEAQLAEKGIDFYKINRGGDITYHGPGQIVGYPIFDLEQFRPDIHEYLRKMEESCIQTLAEYGIESGRIDGLTGVWLDVDGPNPRKIMAIGVRCSRWITMHGFAFNVNTDLSLFDNIIPCGIDDKGVTSIAKELGHAVDIEEVKEKMKAHMADLYGFEWE
ncbi:MAG: lipoyl(octanoyl) transferase LipB [Bacteroidetes bacterium]|nr:lipoyl(octanoyl) transferase LipB [Bacteroidota bacterium]